MKTILNLLFLGLATLIQSQTNRTVGDPIPGADMKVGKKPPGGGVIIANGVTNANGIFEIKDVEAGDYTYYFEINIGDKGIKEKGIRTANPPIITEDFRTDNLIDPSKPGIITETHGNYKIKITITKNVARGVPINT